MPLDHFLPATYLACFSRDSKNERRDRLISVGDKRTGRCYTTSASQVCGINNLYTLHEYPEDPRIVDKTWAYYESRFHMSVEQLINNSINAITWASILVPFVTGLLVRGPDFNERFTNRLGPLADITSKDNTNFSRLIEFQRLLAQITSAKWIVLKTTGDGALITNDLGYSPFRQSYGDDQGIAIPLGSDYILVIVPQMQRAIAYEDNGAWKPYIIFLDLPLGNHKELNKNLAITAQRYIFGPDEGTINQYLYTEDHSLPVVEPYQLGFTSGKIAMQNDLTWHRLLTLLSKPPTNKLAVTFIDLLKPPPFSLVTK